MTDTMTTIDATIERTLELQASPERVWAALTDPTEIGGWFGSAVEFKPEVGASGWFDFGADGRVAYRVEAVEPGRHLAWRWADEVGAAVDDGSSTLVEWWLEPASAEGTRLRMRESGFKVGSSLDHNTFGWLEELGDLRDHLATQPWQHPIRRKLELKAERSRVWHALTDPTELKAWWGDLVDLKIREGAEGWFRFPEYGRHAVRIVAVEPQRYFAWRWTADEQDVQLADAVQPLLVEWVLQEREGGGTDLHLLESGFTGPKMHADNSEGWTDEVLPALVKLIDGESPTPA
jgi:uncharacterized protein YndB with AHSA1/START domain